MVKKRSELESTSKIREKQQQKNCNIFQSWWELLENPNGQAQYIARLLMLYFSSQFQRPPIPNLTYY